MTPPLDATDWNGPIYFQFEDEPWRLFQALSTTPPRQDATLPLRKKKAALIASLGLATKSPNHEGT